MRKIKSYVIDLFNEGRYAFKGHSQTQNADFWTSDTDAWLRFKIATQSVVISSAQINLYNKNDKSLIIEENMTIVNNEAEFRMSETLIEHFGHWSAQVIFIIGGKKHTSPTIEFTVSRELGADLPERLGLIEDWKKLNDDVKSFVAEIEGFTLDQFVELKMGEELQNLENNYATRLTGLETNDANLTAQLAQTKTDPFSRLSNKTNSVVSFYFDDGSTNDYSIVLPIAQKYDIPISIAALPRQNGGQYLTHAQLVELQNVHGWEIGSHTYNHVDSPTLSEEDLNHDYALSKDILEGLGLNITHLCYPFGYYDEKSMKVAKNHYDFALSSDQFSNKSPIRTYSINRIFMPNYTTAQLKAMVDNMHNEWYIFYGHSHDMDFPQSERIKLDDLIGYVKSKNIPIENVTPAYEKFKNIVDVGYQYKDNKFFQVGADGEVAYADGIYKFLGVNPEITVNTPYTDFEIGKISVGVFTNVTNGFPFGVSPNGALGTLYTYRHARHNPSVYQKFELYNGTEVGYRTLSGGAWTGFVKYKPSVKVPIASEITDDTPVDYFSAGSTTIFNISQNQAPNFRGGEPGTLTVSTLGSLALRHQKWHKYNTREQYIRYWISGSTSWGEWLSLGEKQHTITTAMGTIPANGNLTFLLDVPGVKFASSFVTNFTSNLPTGVIPDFSVSAENVIRLRLSNLTTQSIDLGSRVVRVLVF